MLSDSLDDFEAPNLARINYNKNRILTNKKISSFFIANPKDIKSDLKNAGLGKYYSSAWV